MYQPPQIWNGFRQACQLPRRNSTNGLSFLSRSDWIMHLSWRKWKSTSSCEKQSYSSKVSKYKSYGELSLPNLASEEINPSFYECSLVHLKKFLTKCKFDKIDIIQHALYTIRIINCQYYYGTLISIAILFCFLNSKPIFQKLCLLEYNSIFVTFFGKNLQYKIFFFRNVLLI